MADTAKTTPDVAKLSQNLIRANHMMRAAVETDTARYLLINQLRTKALISCNAEQTRLTAVLMQGLNSKDVKVAEAFQKVKPILLEKIHILRGAIQLAATV
jgi:hypothetical protein